MLRLCGAILFAGMLFIQSSFAKSTSQASLEVSNAQYVRSGEVYFRDGADRSQTSLKIGWVGHYDKRSWIAEAKLRDDYQAEEQFHYLKPFDFNVGRETDQYWFRVGRKTYDWSVSDSFWGLGLWQPRFLDDKLNPEEAGFLGAFVGTKGDHVRATVMVSPYFLPDMGPNTVVKDNQFVSSNPWFRPPTPTVILGGTESPILYSLDRPAEKDIIAHEMAATQIEYRPKPNRFVRVSAAYKPMNQLALGGPINLTLSSPTAAAVEVKPRILYHQVTTLEAGVSEETAWSVWGSISQDKIERDSPPPEWLAQLPDDAIVSSAFVGYKIPEGGPQFYAAYLRVDGGDSKDSSPFTLSSALTEQRYMFLDAVRVGFAHRGTWFTNRWGARLDGSFTYDMAEHGILASISVAQALSKYWTLAFSADGLGLLDQSGQVKNGFLSGYRANDRVALGVNYVF